MQTLMVKDTTVYLQGQGDKTIVFVHGWPDTHIVWDQQVQYFQDRYRCVTYTLPGYDGRLPVRGYSLDEVIENLREIIEAVSPDGKVILMIHDWGCVFGYQYYARYAEKVEKIVAIDIGDAAWGSKAFMKESTIAAKLMIFIYQLILATLWSIGGTLGDRLTQMMAKLLGAPGKPNTIGAFMNYPYFIQWFGFLGKYGTYRQQISPTLTCPIFFLYGRKKPFMFHSEHWITKLVANPANAVEKMDATHWVMLDLAKEFNEKVDLWLNQP